MNFFEDILPGIYFSEGVLGKKILLIGFWEGIHQFSINKSKTKTNTFLFLWIHSTLKQFFWFFLRDSITYIYDQLTPKNILKFFLKVLYKCTQSWAIRNFVELEIYIRTQKFTSFFRIFFYHPVAKGFQNSYFFN